MPVVLALGEISVLVVALWTIAACLLIVDIMASVGGIFRHVPVVGGYIAGAVENVAQGISSVLGKAEAGIDAAIGASWHLLARFMDAWWHQLASSAAAYLQLAELVARVVYAHSSLRAIVHAGQHVVHGIEHGVKTLEREWRGIEHRVKRLEREITRGIGHDLHIGLRDLTKEVKGIDQQVTTAIPKAIDYAEAQTTALGRFIGAIPGVSYVEWAAGIVASVIGLDILNSLRCPSFLNSAKKRGCGLWNGIEDVLGLFVDLFIVTDLCEVIPLLETAYEEVAAPAVHLLTEAIDAMPCVAGYQAPPLTVPALHLPPNPGLVLSLP